jgi:diketogulonate reductase-like aldo/keto reductase
MELKRLGSSSILLPEIGLGTSGFTGGPDVLRAGIEHGSFLIDTAESYSTEEIVGKAIRGIRDRVFLATKVAPRHFRQRDLIAAAEGSLVRLGTEYIDLYQLHWPNYMVPIEETVGAMEQLAAAGKVRFVGVSNFSVAELKTAQAATSKFKIVSNQVRYSLIERTVEKGLLQYCQLNDITVIAYSPLGQTLDRVRAHDPGRVLEQVATASGKTCAQVALNWLIAKQNVLAIPRSSRICHVVGNCEASGWRLSDVDYHALSTKIQCRRLGTIGRTARRWKRYLAQSIGREL